MGSGTPEWHLPPGPVRRQLKRVAGDDVTAADFTADEADQLRLWTAAQAQASGVAGRHRSARSRRPWRRSGR